MNKKLSFKKCLNESLNKEDFKSDIYNALSNVVFDYRENITKSDIEEAIEWFMIHFFEDEDVSIDESLETKDYNQFEAALFKAIKDIVTAFKYKQKEDTGFHPTGLTKEDLKNALNSIEDYLAEDLLDESYDPQIECIHSEYDDDFGKQENHYDIETAHEFVDLDDTTPKTRKYEEESEEIDYDDDF